MVPKRFGTKKMPSTGTSLVTGEGTIDLSAGQSATATYAALIVPSTKIVYRSTASPRKISYAGWWALGLRNGGPLGGLADVIGPWWWLDFEAMYVPVPGAPWPFDTIYYQTLFGCSIGVEVFWP